MTPAAETLRAPAAADVEAARERIAGVAVRTPLLRLDVDAPVDVWLKLECLQPIGSFKLRGATNAMRALGPERLAGGVYTASAGNMAQGVAWGARALGVPCTVIVPESAPRAKLDAIERLGARVVRVPFDEWWRVMMEHGRAGMPGTFIHPFADRAVMAGNGTVGLEILEELPGVDAVLVPWGGGGLACGIASALRASAQVAAGVRSTPVTEPARPRVLACEVETAAPLAASLAAGAPADVEYTPSFVDGIGGRSVLEEMWPLARELIDGALLVSPAEVAAAVRLLATRARVVAEGAGAAAVAAALDDGVASRLTRQAQPRQAQPRPDDAGDRRLQVACVVSGGNIDAAKLGVIFAGGVP